MDDELDGVTAPSSDAVSRTTRESSMLATTMRPPLLNDGQRGAAVILKSAIMRIEIISVTCVLYLSSHVINPSYKWIINTKNT